MNLFKFYKNAFLVTIILEIIGCFSILIYLIFFAIFGGAGLIGTELNILLVLIALGISCLITLGGIGFFMRSQNIFVKFIGSEQNYPSETWAEKSVLAIWIAAIIFFSAAVYYGFFLIYQYNVFPVFGNAIGILIVFLILGMVVICLILQGFLFIMARLTKRVVKEVLPK